MNVETPMLPLFQEIEREDERKKHAERVTRATESMRCCWPDWEGPRVEESVHGRCSVGQCVVHSETHGETRYFYCAPCRILEVDAKLEWVRAVVDYPEGSAEWVMHHNGTILKMDITEVWPPTDDLWAIRHAQEEEDAA